MRDSRADVQIKEWEGKGGRTEGMGGGAERREGVGGEEWGGQQKKPGKGRRKGWRMCFTYRDAGVSTVVWAEGVQQVLQEKDQLCYSHHHSYHHP